jgi:hypothetical protein
MPIFQRRQRGQEGGTSSPTLSGKWFGKVNGEPVGMEFLDDGRLAYVVVSDGKQQTILMTFRVDGDVLVTDQPSHPREERTLFRFDNGALVLALAASRVGSRASRR